MHVLLLFLKIIGIVILTLLIAALVIAVVVLCTPVRYRLWGSYHDGRPDLHAGVGFWFNRVNISGSFDADGLKAGIKIFFIKKQIIGGKKKPDEAKEPDDEKVFDDLFEESKFPSDETGDDQESGEVSETLESADKPDLTVNADAEPFDIPKDSKPQSKKKMTACFVGKLEELVDKVKGTVFKLRDLYEKFKKKKEYTEKFLALSSTRHVLFVVKTQLFRILKCVMPRKVSGRLTLGLSDPALMGQICMYAGIFYPLYEKNFSFEPVFDKKVCDGEGEISGRVILREIVFKCLKLLFIRDFYRFISNLKKLIRKLKQE